MSSISLFSFFSGSGFLDLGFESSGYNIEFINEIHEPFVQAYLFSRSSLGIPYAGEVFSDDVIMLTSGKPKNYLKAMIKEARRRSDMIGFIGGPPCPDFSVGGKNRGRDGDNGKLSATYIEIICQQKPDFFLFENVKGLWSTNKHRQFYEELKKEIQRSGYITIDKLINTIEYGVPQDRERVILLGFKKSVLNNLNLRVGKRDELTDDEFPWNNRIIYHAQDIFALDWPKTNEFQEDSVISPPSNIPQELTVEFWFRKNDVYNHENANHYFKPRQGLHRFLTISEGDDSRKSFKPLSH